MPWPWKSRASGGVLALSPGENALRYVYAEQAGETGATVSAWGLEQRGSQTHESFIKRTKAMLPQAAQAVVVLDPADYEILQLEAPNVPPEEVKEAVRWRATEFLEGSANDYTIDVLNIGSGGATPGKVVVVASHNEVILARMRDAEALGLPLSVIDVRETTQRNLLYAALRGEAAPPRVAACLVAEGEWASLVIAVQGELYFFRRFEFNVDLLAVPAEQAQPELIADGEVAEATTRSLTQFHRSLNPWDDAYAHLPLETLRVHAGPKTAAIVQRLAPEAGVDTRPLSLSRVFRARASRSQPPWEDAAYLPLLGALLRPWEAQ